MANRNVASAPGTTLQVEVPELDRILAALRAFEAGDSPLTEYIQYKRDRKAAQLRNAMVRDVARELARKAARATDITC